MLAQTLEGARPTGGHPAWHFGVVALAAVGVFLGLKWKERPRHGLIHGREPGLGKRCQTWRPALWPALPPALWPAWQVLTLALASAVCSGIHIVVCPAHFGEATVFGVFFLIAAAAQASWAVLIVLRPTRMLLRIGAIANAGVVVIWTLTRTTGLPIGPGAWRPESIGALDAFATQLELGVILGACWLMFHAGQGVQRRRSTNGVMSGRPG